MCLLDNKTHKNQAATNKVKENVNDNIAPKKKTECDKPKMSIRIFMPKIVKKEKD